MNAVPFLCPMALNLHQKRPSPVTSGWLFRRAIRREIAVPSFVLMAMVQQSYPHHPSFRHTIRREIAAPSFVLMGDDARELPRRGYTFDRAGLMSAAKSTLSDDVRHSILPPWGLYFFNSPRYFPIDARFRGCVNHYDAMPAQ